MLLGAIIARVIHNQINITGKGTDSSAPNTIHFFCVIRQHIKYVRARQSNTTTSTSTPFSISGRTAVPSMSTFVRASTPVLGANSKKRCSLCNATSMHLDRLSCTECIFSSTHHVQQRTQLNKCYRWVYHEACEQKQILNDAPTIENPRAMFTRNEQKTSLACPTPPGPSRSCPCRWCRS